MPRWDQVCKRQISSGSSLAYQHTAPSTPAPSSHQISKQGHDNFHRAAEYVRSGGINLIKLLINSELTHTPPTQQVQTTSYGGNVWKSLDLDLETENCE